MDGSSTKAQAFALFVAKLETRLLQQKKLLPLRFRFPVGKTKPSRRFGGFRIYAASNIRLLQYDLMRNAK